MLRHHATSAAILLGLFVAGPVAAQPGWKPDAAAKYLDDKATGWLKYRSAQRGDGATKTTCVTCHTTFAYAVARPALRAVTGEAATEQEKQILADVRTRALNWDKQTTDAVGYLYDFGEKKRIESVGTEAVLNAYLLALDDAAQKAKEPTEATRAAFANLWKEQVKDGKTAGSWDWLTFDLEPWETEGSRYYGASIALLAVSAAPGYKAPAEPLAKLRGYLRDQFATQHLYNRVWGLRASNAVPDLLTAEQRQGVVTDLFKKQHADGGWALAELGGFTRKDGSDAETASDGYATGLVVHTLLGAGVKGNDANLAKAVAWLKANQQANGSWRGYSPNRDRAPATFQGAFLSNAATAYAAMALAAVK